MHFFGTLLRQRTVLRASEEPYHFKSDGLTRPNHHGLAIPDLPYRVYLTGEYGCSLLATSLSFPSLFMSVKVGGDDFR